MAPERGSIDHANFFMNDVSSSVLEKRQQRNNEVKGGGREREREESADGAKWGTDMKLWKSDLLSFDEQNVIRYCLCHVGVFLRLQSISIVF